MAAGEVVCLQGELGAGKTTLVQGIAQGWGSLDRVSSPTFVLVNEYRRPDGAYLFHLDAYRLESEPAAAELDIDRMLSEGGLVVEWPDRIPGALPDARLSVLLEYVDDQRRRMLFQATATRYDEMLQGLQRAMFGVA
jgi:tRNA threonylcarbamoyladenosine biosynthesis protein TsaE